MKRFILLSMLLILLVAGAISGAGAAGDLSAKEARRLIARVAGIELPSDAVRVKEVSSLGSSAVVVAQVETAFRFVRGDDDKWRVAEVRTGDNKWEDIEMIARAVNAEKAERARAELETMATALESFRRERGFYVVTDKQAALVDQLNPRYLSRVIRVDPWHKPYLYEGTRDHFTLRSSGMDGKEKTPDDVVISSRN
ncbi:MAG: type II secretion system protein GspG [Acidobacteria bacterium]|nr:type II secretion system protein GspG [Acidobacteriota bacterium]